MTQEWQAQHEAEKKEQEDKKEASKADKAERADRARSKRNKDTDDGFLAPDDAVELDVDALRRDKAKKQGSDASDSGSESSEESSSEESVASGGEDAPAAKERKAAAADSSERSALRKRKESKVEKREKVRGSDRMGSVYSVCLNTSALRSTIRTMYARVLTHAGFACFGGCPAQEDEAGRSIHRTC